MSQADYTPTSPATSLFELNDVPDAPSTNQALHFNPLTLELEWDNTQISELVDVQDIPAPTPGFFLKRNTADTGYQWDAGGSYDAGWVDVRDYSPADDGGSDLYVSVTNGSATITSVNNPWISSDVGKPFSYRVGGVNYNAVINSFIDAGTITLGTGVTAATTSYVPAGWGTDNSVALQAAITAGGAESNIYFPPHAKYNIGGNPLVTADVGQAIFSMGHGCEIINGHFQVDHIRAKIDTFRLTGVGTYGLLLTDNTLQTHTTYTAGTRAEKWFTQANVHSLYIWNRDFGLFNENGQVANWFHNMRIWNCNKGLYIDHKDHPLIGGVQSGDSGDWHFVSCRITACDTAADLVKIGGCSFTDTKFHNNSTYGLLIKPKNNISSTSPGVQGTYVTGCEFENNNNQSIYVTADAAVSSGRWPKDLIITGGTIQGIVLDKCDDVRIGPIMNWTASGPYLTQNVNATNVVTVGCPHVKTGKRGGAGTSYLDIGMENSTKAVLNSGVTMEFTDSSGTKTLSVM